MEQWISYYGYLHVLGSEAGHVCRMVMELEVEGQRSRGSPAWIWKRQAKDEWMDGG